MADQEPKDSEVNAATDAEVAGVPTTQHTEDDSADTSNDGAAEQHDAKGAQAEADSETDDDDLDLPMDEINALLDASNSNRKGMNAQMRRVAQREAESQRRVEETVKNTKTSPRWYVPLFCALMIIGLLWAVVYYLTSSMNGSSYPIPALKQWNLLVAFVIMLVGFIMTVAWH